LGTLPLHLEEQRAVKRTLCQSIQRFRKGTSTMSETKNNYQAELAAWVERAIVAKLASARDEFAESGDESAWDQVRQAVQEAIRAKMLESFRNGQETRALRAAPPRRLDRKPNSLLRSDH
jgi:hypothetical protein